MLVQEGLIKPQVHDMIQTPNIEVKDALPISEAVKDIPVA